MLPDQVNVYEKYYNIVIVDMISKTNQFDMILMLIIVIDNNFRNIIVVAAILEDETDATFIWILQELKNFTLTVLYSDADPALISVIKTNYSKTPHFPFSWACYYAINQNFTAGIQSTQWVESTNKIIKDRLNRFSCLTNIVKEMVDDFYQQEMIRKNDYDQPQFLFSLLIKNILYNSIRQVWKTTKYCEQKSELQHIILLDDGLYLCTCLWLTVNP
ncbi:hypothetical protein RhiirB3_443531 [Rhizophagus irregularis]|nr:hypothetical protein RhiirB3_443531 [Rhizophagus irregularis]